MFWSHFWFPYAIMLLKNVHLAPEVNFEWFQGLQDTVLLIQFSRFVLTSIIELHNWGHTTTGTSVHSSMQDVVNHTVDRILLDKTILTHIAQLKEKYGSVEVQFIYKFGLGPFIYYVCRFWVFFRPKQSQNRHDLCIDFYFLTFAVGF